jgi:hypothetical protein
MSEIKIHPAAECVRLMDAEELASLASSIEANGLRDPIILGRVNGADSEMLVDGRNRLRACEMAKVEPRFEVMQFKDDEAIKAYVIDKTEHRNISKGQKAMLLALLYPEGTPGKKTKTSSVSKEAGFSASRLSQARAVLAYSRDIAIAVRDGTKKLDEALGEVKRAQDALITDEERLTQLRNEAPDLADLVDEDRMKPTEAIAALEQRAAERRNAQSGATQLLARVMALIGLKDREPVQAAADLMSNINPKMWPADQEDNFTPERLQASADWLAECARILKEQQERQDGV